MEYSETDNVTRFRPRPRASSLGNLSDTSLFESTRISLPLTNMSDIDSAANQKICDLENRLLSANNEIENILMENGDLKMQIEHCKKVIEMYKKIESGDTYSSPFIGRKRKRQRLSMRITETTKNTESMSTEQPFVVAERQQKTIDELNYQIQQLQKWIEEEKNKNTELKKKPKKKNKMRIAVAKNKYKTRTMSKKCKNISKRIYKLQQECTELRKENEDLELKIQEMQTHVMKDKTYNIDILNQNLSVDINGEENSEKETKDNNQIQIINTKEKPIIESQKDKHKIIILADQRGFGLRKTLQHLVGPNYEVTSFWKANATLEDILSSNREALLNLTENDYIVMLGGMNDCNPENFKFVCKSFFNYFRFTNVIVYEIPFNKSLNEFKLNYELRRICTNYKHVVYIDMGYSKYVPNRYVDRVNVCKAILRELAQREYEAKLQERKVQVLCKHKNNVANVGTQTDMRSAESSPIANGTTADSKNTKNFFRG